MFFNDKIADGSPIQMNNNASSESEPSTTATEQLYAAETEAQHLFDCDAEKAGILKFIF